MYKRTVFTTLTPLPPYILRETVIETLHDHKEMIELNPLVTKFETCKPAPFCPPDEFQCTWYELTDKISYLPGSIVQLQSNVKYKACFHDLPRGLQTHVYAPLGLDIRDKWTVCGNMPGEPREPVELGLADAPREGLYLREDIDMRCHVLATSFVKKTLKKAHSVLVDRLILKADRLKELADAQGRHVSSMILDPMQQQQASPAFSASGSLYSAQSPTASDCGSSSYRDSRMRPASLSVGSGSTREDGLRISGAPAGFHGFQQYNVAEMPGSPPAAQSAHQIPPELRISYVSDQKSDGRASLAASPGRFGTGPAPQIAELE